MAADLEPAADALPAVSLLGGTDGPIVALLGGVHGDETEGVLAIRALVRHLGGPHGPVLRGTLRWLAPAHPAAWAADARTSPVDGLNLARVFPGDPDGQPTERLAAHISTQLIAGSDLLIDLHSGGRGFEMPLLCGFHSSGPLADRAAAAAAAFAAPLTWRHPRGSTGRSLSAASDLAVPSIYVEGRGGGRLRQDDLDGYVDGVLRVLKHLGMIDQAPAAGRSQVVHGDGDTDAGIVTEAAGWFVTRRAAGARVRAGEVIAAVVDDDAQPRTQVRAPAAGVVMLLRRASRVEPGDTVAIVATTGGEVSP